MRAVPRTIKAIRLHSPGVDGLRYEEIETPSLGAGEALIDVHAAAITRDELEWPLDRLPAIPSYELSGLVAAVADDVAMVATGDEVFALTPFDRDGVASEYAAVPAAILAPKPSALGLVGSAAVPLPAFSACRALFPTGHLRPASGCSYTARWAVSASSLLSWRVGAMPTSPRPRRPTRSTPHASSERTRCSTAGASSTTVSAPSISCSTPSAACSSRARPPCSQAADVSSPSPRSRPGKGRTSLWNRPVSS